MHIKDADMIIKGIIECLTLVGQQEPQGTVRQYNGALEHILRQPRLLEVLQLPDASHTELIVLIPPPVVPMIQLQSPHRHHPVTEVPGVIDGDVLDGVPGAAHGPKHVHRPQLHGVVEFHLEPGGQGDEVKIHVRAVTGGAQVTVQDAFEKIGPEGLALEGEGDVRKQEPLATFTLEAPLLKLPRIDAGK